MQFANSGSFKKGNKPLAPFRKGNVPWNKGKEFISIRGEKNPNWIGGKVITACKNCGRDFKSYLCQGRSFCSYVCKNQKLRRYGTEHHNWITDRTKLKKSGDSEKDRRCSAYVTWRREVWMRDSFKCKIANTDCNGRIEAHHILSWRDYPELRYQVNNGITLCHFHHPRRREDEKRLQSGFQTLVSVSKAIF